MEYAHPLPSYVYAGSRPLSREQLEQHGLVPVESPRAAAGHTCSADSCDCAPPELDFK